MDTDSIRRILVVDDDPDILRLASLSLARVGGYEVEALGSGAEAVEAVRTQRPDVIILDVQMDGLDGLQTLELLRAQPRLNDVPVLFLTADSGRHSEGELIAAGAAGVLGKPFDPMTLPQAMRDLLASL